MRRRRPGPRARQGTRDTARLRTDDLRVARGHDEPDDRAAGRQDVVRPASRVPRRRRPTSAATCGAPSSPRSSRSSATRGGPAPRAGAPLARDDGAPLARRPVLQLVRPPHRRRAEDLAVDGGPAHADPLVGRQRLARGRPAHGRHERAGGRRAAPASSTTAWTSGFYYRPGRSTGSLFHIRARPPATSPCCYDTIVSESRIATYIGIAKGEMPDQGYFGTWRTFPDTCDWSWQETKPIGVDRTYARAPPRQVVRGRIPVRRAY